MSRIIKNILYTESIGPKPNYLVKVFNINPDPESKQFHMRILIEFSQDMKYIITNSFQKDDMKVYFWDYFTGDYIKSIKVDWYLKSLYIPQNTDYLIIEEHIGKISIWDLNSFECIKKIDLEHSFFTQIALTSDFNYIFSGDNEFNFHNLITLWDSNSKKVLNTLNGHTKCVNALKLTSDNRYLISGSSDGMIGVWNITRGLTKGITGILVQKLKGHKGDIECLDISPDNHYIVSGAGPDDQSVKVWELKTGRLIHSFLNNYNVLTEVKFSPNGRFIVTSSYDNSVIVYNIDGTKMYGPFYHKTTVQRVRWVENGKYVASADLNGEIRIWDFKKDEKEIKKDQQVVIHPKYIESNHHFCASCISFTYMIRYFKKEGEAWSECSDEEADIGMEYCPECNSALRIHDLDTSNKERYYMWDQKSGNYFSNKQSHKIIRDIFEKILDPSKYKKIDKFL